MNNRIEYHKNSIYNRYFIWFDSEQHGMLMGDIELCDFIGISLNKFDELIYKYHKEVIFPYKMSEYRVTYFSYEKDVQNLIEQLEPFLVFKKLKDVNK